MDGNSAVLDFDALVDFNGRTDGTNQDGSMAEKFKNSNFYQKLAWKG